MSRVLFVIVTILAMFVSGEPSAFAESKAIRQLPTDVARWSTLWLAVPKDMVEVDREHGPLAALTWGPVKGTASFVRSSVAEVWETVKVDQQRERQRPAGAILYYEF